MKGTRTILRSSSSCSMLSCHSASASEEYSDMVSKSDSSVDSEGREASSSSDSEYEFCREGTMYADIENDGFELSGEGKDMVEIAVKRREGGEMRGSDVDQAAACLLRFNVNVRATGVCLDRTGTAKLRNHQHVTV